MHLYTAAFGLASTQHTWRLIFENKEVNYVFESGSCVACQWSDKKLSYFFKKIICV